MPDHEVDPKQAGRQPSQTELLSCAQVLGCPLAQAVLTLAQQSTVRFCACTITLTMVSALPQFALSHLSAKPPHYVNSACWETFAGTCTFREPLKGVPVAKCNPGLANVHHLSLTLAALLSHLTFICLSPLEKQVQ